METQISNTSPVTNVGSDVPRRTKTELAVSGTRPRNFAAITPNVTPTVTQRIKAPKASETVIGSVSFKRSVTQAFSLNE